MEGLHKRSKEKCQQVQVGKMNRIASLAIPVKPYSLFLFFFLRKGDGADWRYEKMALQSVGRERFDAFCKRMG